MLHAGVAVCCLQSCESRAVMAEEQLAHLQVGCLQALCFEKSVQAALLLLCDQAHNVDWVKRSPLLISMRSCRQHNARASVPC
jgi:hypothetical protein